MIPRIKDFKALDGYKLKVAFDSGDVVVYDVGDDIANIKAFEPLLKNAGLFRSAILDTSRTVIYWTDMIDLPSDTILEYGEHIA